MKFRPVANESAFVPLLEACAGSNIQAGIRQFEPAHVPAVLVDEQDGVLERFRLMDALNTSGGEASGIDWGISFFLNASNPLVQQLAIQEEAVQRAVVRSLYCMAYMVAMPRLAKSEVHLVHAAFCDVMSESLNMRVESQVHLDARLEPSRMADETPICVFVMLPNERSELERAIRFVFEGPPYFFEVFTRNDFALGDSDVWRGRLQRADAYVADITELCPSVLLELGAALYPVVRKPIFLLRHELRDEGTAKSLPHGLRQLAVTTYDARLGDPEVVAAGIRSRLELQGQPAAKELSELLSVRRCRAVTRTLLERSTIRLSGSKVAALLSNFRTVESIVDATLEELERKIGLKDYEAKFLRDSMNSYLVMPQDMSE